MAGLTQRHKIALVMGAACRQRNNMMHLRSHRHPVLAPAHFTQGMHGNKPAPNGWPRAVVPFLHFRRSAVAIVLGRDQLLVRRAVLPVRQLRAAGIAAGMLGFPGHFPCLRFLLIHYSQCTHGQSFQVRFESILVRFSPIESGIFKK
nr:MAG TPA: hypothetical protein [Caudoviricetes sp.]